MIEAPRISDQVVAISRGQTFYPSVFPYDPDSAYPELAGLAPVISTAPNPAYEGVRNALRLLGCDAQHIGSPEWNPMTMWARPGDRVLVKPNWVMDSHPREEEIGVQAAFDCLVTHTSILRAVIDYLQIALRGHGRIVVADAPLQGCDFAALSRRARLTELVEYYDLRSRVGAPGGFRILPIEIMDLRLEIAHHQAGIAGIGGRLEKERREESSGHAIVRLDRFSSLEPIASDAEAFRVTCYDPASMTQAHGPARHAYCVSREVLEADVVVNVPKLKTHKKGGVTVALKNLVGINGHKSFLPHHRKGSVAEGGDEYLALDTLKGWASDLHDVAYRASASPWRQRLALLGASAFFYFDRFFRDDGTESGSWWGNDTIWRTCLDLNRILLYAGSNGDFCGRDSDSQPMRKVVHIVDGIHGGDRDGPLAPRPRPSGVVIAGSCAAYVDLAAASVMGLAWRTIPMITGAFGPFAGAPLTRGSPEDLRVSSDEPAWQGAGANSSWNGSLGFEPAPGWEGVVDSNRPGVAVPLRAAVRRPGTVWDRLASGSGRA